MARGGGARRPVSTAKLADEIRALCAVAQLPEWADWLISSCRSLDEARTALFKRLADESGPDFPPDRHESCFRDDWCFNAHDARHFGARDEDDGMPNPEAPRWWPWGQWEKRPDVFGVSPPSFTLKRKDLLTRYLSHRARAFESFERERGGTDDAEELAKRVTAATLSAYDDLAEYGGFPNALHARQWLVNLRVSAPTFERDWPPDAPPPSEAAEARWRAWGEKIDSALRFLPPPAPTMDARSAFDRAVGLMIRAGVAIDEDDAARILQWRDDTGRNGRPNEILRTWFRNRVGVDLESLKMREAADSWCEQRRAIARSQTVRGKGRPTMLAFNRAAAATAQVVRTAKDSAHNDLEATTVALLYHGWYEHLGKANNFAAAVKRVRDALQRQGGRENGAALRCQPAAEGV